MKAIAWILSCKCLAFRRDKRGQKYLVGALACQSYQAMYDKKRRFQSALDCDFHKRCYESPIRQKVQDSMPEHRRLSNYMLLRWAMET